MSQPLKYNYSASKGGKRIEGTMRAMSENAVQQVLEADGYAPGRIVPAARNPLAAAIESIGSARSSGGPKVKALELSTITKQFEVLLRAGQPPARVIEASTEAASNRKLKGVLDEMVDRLRQGDALSEAFASYPRTFSESYIAYVASAEQTGRLPDTFLRLYEQVAQQAKIDSEIKSATAYPKWAGAVAFLLAMAMVVFLLPRFEEIFAGFDADLPAPTQALIWFSDNIHWFIGSMLLAWFGFKQWLEATRESQRVGIFLDNVKYRMPVFGKLFKQQALYRWTATMSGLNESGVQIIDSLKIAARASGSRLMVIGTEDAIDRIRDGDSLSESMESIPLITKMVKSLAETGEKAGDLPGTFKASADTIAHQVDAIVGSLGKRIEVVTMLLVMAIMGGIVAALWLPILQLSVAASEGI